MGKVKQFFSDLSALLFMSIGISTTRTKQRKFDLRKLVSNANRSFGAGRGREETWILINRAASSVEYEGRQAVMFDSRSGTGLAWIEGLRFYTGKIDLNIAAAPQDVGIAFHIRSEGEFEAVCFSIGNEAQNEGENQHVVVKYLSTYPDRNASHESHFDLPYGRSGEWFKARISISREVIAVFIDGDNLPTLKVGASESGEVYGSVGLWIGPGSAAIVDDFRIHVVRRDIENQIRSIFGGNPVG
ncbi:MAG: hypothetical protein J2P52_16600 [Blastocatellia bacterium]|nr:hypothetical protein [Blastocatellia bacterium]